MIKVEKITIEEFRGIRSISLDLNAGNFAICGPNGTGKSGVVDAIEFALTGSISRLTGQGRGALSVLKHGPHVDSSKAPEKARITLEIVVPSTGKRAIITRDVKNGRSPVITPNDPDIRAALEDFERHPEFVLSRREIIKYVLAEPGERAKEVQALLQLDDLETMRVLLQKISNAHGKELVPLQQEEVATRNALMRAMEITEITSESVLAVANQRRKILGLPDLKPSLKGFSLRDGMDSLAPSITSRVPKVQARADITTAIESIKALLSEVMKVDVAPAIEAIKKLQGDEVNLKALTKESLLRRAIEVFDEHVCPICETEWDPEHFKQVVKAQLQRLEIATQARTATERLLVPVIQRVNHAIIAIRSVVTYASLFSTPVSIVELTQCTLQLTERENAMRKFLPLTEVLAALNFDDLHPEQALQELEAISRLVEVVPDPTERDAARDYINVADERLKAYRVAAAKAKAGERKAEIAKVAFETFGRATNEALEKIYKEVEKEFKSFYRAINDDESAFEARLTPSIGKLGFDVNFYGRGEFPPGAYHSEGHQDAMGLCLYLALMRHILGNGFTLAVLDDVLMSVDAGHRREVCRLLKTEFSDTQFVLTTHDPVWLRHMKTAGLIGEPKAGIEFQNWDVNKGPTQWKDIDVWDEIDGYIGKNDMRGAASLLRYYMEYSAAEYCNALGGKVEYRADNKYDLGDLLPGAACAMRDLLKKAKSTADKRGDAGLSQEIIKQQDAFNQAGTLVLDVEWQYLNVAIHYNELESLSKTDFRPVATAFKALSEQFICDECKGGLYITRVGHKKDTLRCPCAKLSFSLV